MKEINMLECRLRWVHLKILKQVYSVHRALLTVQPILKRYMELYCDFSSRMYPSATHQEYMNNLCMYIYPRSFAGDIAKEIILFLWLWDPSGLGVSVLKVLSEKVKTEPISHLHMLFFCGAMQRADSKVLSPLPLFIETLLLSCVLSQLLEKW